jgi:hypothetical protein
VRLRTVRRRAGPLPIAEEVAPVKSDDVPMKLFRQARRQHTEAKFLAETITQTQEAIAKLGNQSLTAQPGYEDVVVYVAGWLNHINKSIEAVALLHDKGYGALARPMQRLIIEHSVACAMVAIEPESWTAFLRASHDGAVKLAKAFRANDIQAPEELSYFIEFGLAEEPDPFKRYRQIKNRFESLGETGRRLYQAWLEETQLSHGGFPTASMFLKISDDSIDAPFTSTDIPQIDANPVHVIASALDGLLMAADAFSFMLLGDPLRQDIERLNNQKEGSFARLHDQRPV